MRTFAGWTQSTSRAKYDPAASCNRFAKITPDRDLGDVSAAIGALCLGLSRCGATVPPYEGRFGMFFSPRAANGVLCFSSRMVRGAFPQFGAIDGV